MLFNSYIFIIFFFFVYLGHLMIKGKALSYFYLFASLMFFSFGSFNLFALICLSVLMNFVIASCMVLNSKGMNLKLILGVILNLVPLFYFKYKYFLSTEVLPVFGFEGLNNAVKIALPLGISFFTFQQIGYLVDVSKSGKSHSLLKHALFITFFPQIVAGPIVHHSDLVPEFDKNLKHDLKQKLFVHGTILFVLGLAKKTLLADKIATFVDPVFYKSSISTLTFFESITATFGYTAQIYFDFSGYSDMAIGLSAMLGIRMFLNFDSPYKSQSVSEFWRRWHISLGNFLRDYVYIPLGGNRTGLKRQITNLMITMLIGGIWHGAGWTFIIWGMLHGLFLVINLLWQRIPWNLPKFLGILLTFLCVAFAWIFFRAENLSSAQNVLSGFTSMDYSNPGDNKVILSLLFCLLIIVMPNVFSFIPKADILSNQANSSAPEIKIPDWFWGWPSALVIILVFLMCVRRFDETSKFLYFNF